MQRIKVLILTTSVFTDRIYQHSSFLDEFKKKHTIEIWARSFVSNSADWEIRDVKVKPIPVVREIKHWLNLLRRINEFAWMYKLPAHSIKINLKYSKNPNSLKLLRACGWLIALLNCHQLFEKFLQKLILSKSAERNISHLLKESNPDCIIVSNPFWVEEPIVALEAIKLKIPVISLIPSWDNITTKSRMIYQSDAFGVWSSIRVNELHKYYPQSLNAPVFLYGTPQYDIFKNPEFIVPRKTFYEKYSLDENIPIILYTLGSPYFISSEITACLAFCRVALQQGLLDHYQVLIRPHPIKDFSEFLSLFKEVDTRIKIQSDVQTLSNVQYRYQDKSMIKNWVSSFYYSDIIIATSSTTILDASMMNKRHINITANLTDDRSLDTFIRDVSFGFEHLQTLNERKLLNNVNSFEEISGQLIKHKISDNSIPDRSADIVQHLSEYENTGKYGEIFADKLASVIINLKN